MVGVIASGGTAGDSVSFNGNVLVKNVAGTVQIVGAPVATQTYADPTLAGTSVNFGAGATALEVSVTGLAATAINWFAQIQYQKVVY